MLRSAETEFRRAVNIRLTRMEKIIGQLVGALPVDGTPDVAFRSPAMVQLDRIEALLKHLAEKVDTTMAALQDLKDDVSANSGVVQSAITLLNGLHQQLADAIASGDPAQVQALADQLKTDTSALAAAVVANTPAAAPAPAPTPTP